MIIVRRPIDVRSGDRVLIETPSGAAEWFTVGDLDRAIGDSRHVLVLKDGQDETTRAYVRQARILVGYTPDSGPAEWEPVVARFGVAVIATRPLPQGVPL